jgi:hypothetical protein
MWLTPEQQKALRDHGWYVLDEARGWWRREETLRGDAEAAEKADRLMGIRGALERFMEDM